MSHEIGRSIVMASWPQCRGRVFPLNNDKVSSENILASCLDWFDFRNLPRRPHVRPRIAGSCLCFLLSPGA